MFCEFTETGDAAELAGSSSPASEASRPPLRICVSGRGAVATLFRQYEIAGAEMRVVAAGNAALEALREGRIAILVVEAEGRRAAWEELLGAAREISPATRILVVAPGAHAVTGLRAMQAGAHGYLSGSDWAAKLPEALAALAEDRFYLAGALNDHFLRCALREQDWTLGSPVDLLSDRELEVLEQLGRRRGVREVAGALRLSVKTVETHRSNIARKLGLESGAAVGVFGASWLAGQGLAAPLEPAESDSKTGASGHP